MALMLRLLAVTCLLAVCVQGRVIDETVVDRLFQGVSNDNKFTGKQNDPAKNADPIFFFIS